MKTLTIREKGDRVFFLDSEGFKEGYVHSVIMTSDSQVEYRVKVKDDAAVYGGYPRLPDQLWDSAEEMVWHYAKKIGVLKEHLKLKEIKELLTRLEATIKRYHEASTPI